MKKVLKKIVGIAMSAVIAFSAVGAPASFADDSKSRAQDALAELTGTFELSKSGEYIYPDNFAGTWYDDGILHVIATDERGISYYKEILKDRDHVEYELAKFSLNELRSIQKKLSGDMQSIEGLVSISVSQKYNKIYLGVCDVEKNRESVREKVWSVVNENNYLSELLPNKNVDNKLDFDDLFVIFGSGVPVTDTDASAENFKDTDKKISKKSTTIAVGEKDYLRVSNADGEISWESSDDSVAEVNGGVVTGKKPGKARIQAKTGGITLTCNVTVKKYRLDKASSSMTVGENMTITVKGYPCCEEIFWSSLNEDVLSVNESGIVTALGVGEGKVRAKMGGHTITTTINVKPFSPSINENDVAYIKYTPAVFHPRGSSAEEKSLFITDASVIAEITGIINERQYLPLSNEKIFSVTEKDISRRKKKVIEAYIVRDSMVLYNSKGDEIAVLSANEEVYDSNAFLSRLFINEKYYYCPEGDIRLTAIANSWKDESVLIQAAKSYCEKNGKSVSGEVSVVYNYLHSLFNDREAGYLDDTYIYARIEIGGNLVLVAPSTGEAYGFSDPGEDD